MTELLEKLKKVANESILDEGVFLVELKSKGHAGQLKLIVLLDGDKGITIDQCSAVSRKMGETIEEAEMIQGKYTLEVSSPGVSAPLKLFRQYPKHIGRKINIKTIDEDLEGKLTAVNDEFVTIQIKGKKKKELITKEILFKNVNEAKILVSFDI